MKAMAVLVLLVLLPCVSTATVWHVDQHGGGDFTTIQAAINAAAPGDEVIVDSGTYVENIDYLGKDLLIHSVSGYASTTIDGGHAGSCVTFRNHETAAATLDGFTLTSGTGTVYGGETVGGAIFCLLASPKIHDCLIVSNSCTYAAGAYVDQGEPDFANCTFRGNTAATYGGGIAGPNSRPTISYCLFENNSAGTGDGTIHLALTSPITHCVFRNNQARSGAAINSGGFSAEYLIQDCVFEGNFAHEQHGGAIRIHEANATVERCLFVDNSAVLDGGAIIVLDAAAPQIRNCTFYQNHAGRYGGGIAIWNASSPEITNCIISQSATGGGISCFGGNYPIFACDDAWANAGGNYTGECGDPTGQGGNISADPLFCDPEGGDFQLYTNSPCAPDHNPACGLIGAYDVGCQGPTATRPMTWGGIKALYR